MTRLLIKNIDLITTMNDKGSELRNCDILTNDSVIEQLASGIPAPDDARIIDGRGTIAFPGFVNVHHHMYQIFTRDLAHILGAVDLFDWLRLNYLLWGSLDEEMVYVSALVGLGLLMKTGCSLVSDLYYIFPDKVVGKLIDAEIRAARELGVRFHPTRGAVSKIASPEALAPGDVCQSEEEILLDYERLVNAYHNPSPLSMLRIGLAPVNPVTSTKHLLVETIRFARKHGLYCHTHLAESPLENEWSMKNHGMREFDYLESIGWVGRDVWFAHGLFLEDDEIRRMGNYHCGLAHCPTSNARIGSIAPVFKMMEHGVRVGFGVDGMGGTGDMVAELQTALTLHSYRQETEKEGSRNGITDLARSMLGIATKGGAEVLGWDMLGTLEPGKAADIVLFDTHLLDFGGVTSDLATSFVCYASSHLANTTIINGEVVVEKGKLTRIDEDTILEQATRLSQDFLKRARERTGIDYTKL